MRNYADVLNEARREAVVKFQAHSAGGGNIGVKNSSTPRATCYAGRRRRYALPVKPSTRDFIQAVVKYPNLVK